MEQIDTLPIQCYYCSQKISEEVQSVLLTCSCLATMCQECAKYQLIINLNNQDLDSFSILQCQICGLNTPINAGFVHNIEKVKKAEEGLLKRAFASFSITIPRRSADKIDKYIPLIKKFSEISLTRSANELLDCKNIDVMKLTLARIEYLRNGPLDEEIFFDWPYEQIESDCLPLGPLNFIKFTRNNVLEKLLTEPYEIDMSCFCCGELITIGNTVLFSCECLQNICKECAIITMLNNKRTYHDGLLCSFCKRFSTVSFGNVKEVHKEEVTVLKKVIERLNVTTGKKYGTSKNKLREIIQEHYFLRSLTPKGFVLEENCTLEQLKLQLVRLEAFRLSKETNTITSTLDGLPLGPLRLLNVKNNAFLELFMKYTEHKQEEDLVNFDVYKFSFDAIKLRSIQPSKIPVLHEEAESSRRFDRLKAITSTECPICSINPFNSHYLKFHLYKIHGLMSSMHSIDEDAVQSINVSELLQFSQRSSSDINASAKADSALTSSFNEIRDFNNSNISMINELQQKFMADSVSSSKPNKVYNRG